MSKVSNLRASIIAALRSLRQRKSEATEKEVAEEIAEYRYHFVASQRDWRSWVPGPILRFLLKPQHWELEPTLNELERTGKIRQRREKAPARTYSLP